MTLYTMFGKKDKNNIEPEQPITARIETMPGAFYGGSDPVIYQNAAVKSDTATPITVTPPLIAPKPPLIPPKAQPPRPILAPPAEKSALQKPQLPPPSSKKNIFIIAGIILLLLLCVLGYYLYPILMSTGTTPPVTPATTTPFVASPPVTPPIIPTTTPIFETPTTTISTTSVQRGGGTLILPSISYAASRDDDADALTTREEEVFLTDPEVWDTDNDGYFDGLEISNLYNPKGIAPQKIIDSGLVREYVNPVYQYRFYYPASWRVDAVAQDFNDILISADSGDYIEIRIFPKETNISFASWFGTTLPGENFLSLNSFSSRFQVPGYKRADSQVGFFETPTAIYSVIYFYGEEKNLYPHIMEMVLQSFRPTKGGFDLPVQPILPGVEAPTTTPVLSTSTTSTVSPLSEPTTTTPATFDTGPSPEEI